MAVLQLLRKSTILNRQVMINVLLPDTVHENEILQVIWLCHGMGDNGTGWLRKTRLEQLISNDRVAVISPDMGNSFYLNQKYGEQYQDYFITELMPEMWNILPLSRKPADNFLLGNSMGGFGALHIFLLMPQQFSRVALLSPVTNLAVLRDLLPNYQNIFGTTDVNEFADYLKKQVAALESNDNELYIRIGTNDFLHSSCEQFVSYLKRKTNLRVDYAVNEGDHDWQFWDAELQSAIEWLNLRKEDK